MKLTNILFAILFISSMAFAQATVSIAPKTPAPTPSMSGNLGLPMPPGFTPPAGLLEEWWKDPAIATELRLTEAQKKQMDDATLSQRLGVIDAAADGLKAFTRLAAMIDADQLDDAAYKQQVTLLSTAAGHLVQTFGDMAITPRRVLTAEQWKKLVSIRAARKAASQPTVGPHEPATRRTPAPTKP